MDEKINYKNLIQKFAPTLALTVLTIAFILYFKESKEGFSSFIEEGTNGLVDFYTDNLKPILVENEISNEDVFNFAMYKNLPIDKTNGKYLNVGTGSEGQEFVEVVPGKKEKESENYKNFIEKIGLSSAEVVKMDSIMESYKPEIFASVLVDGDGNDIYAIDPSITHIRKNLVVDLLNVIENKNVKNRKSNQNAIKARYHKKPTKLTDLPDYIVLAEDTLLEVNSNFDKQQFINTWDKFDKISDRNKLERSFDSMDLNFTAISPSKSSGTLRKIDSPKRVYIPQKFSDGVVVTDCEEFETSAPVVVFNADSLTDVLNFAINSAGSIAEISAEIGTNVVTDVAFEANMVVLEELGEILSSYDFSSWEEFGIEMDSAYQKKMMDSVAINIKAKVESEQFKAKIKSFEKKMMQWGEKMEKSMKKNSEKTDKK